MSALQQQTEEWLEMRKNKIGASDAVIIMDASPWKTKYQLWEEKIGIRESSYKSKSMQRGLDLEDKARDKFEEMTGLCVFPSVVFHPEHEWMMASLDGMDIGKEHIVEIKCPGEKDHDLAKKGTIPEKYIPQLQHQMEVCQMDMAYYFSFDGQDGVILEMNRQDKYIKKMINKEKEFWDCLQNFTAPEMSERDFQHKTDELWCAASSQWLSINQQLSALERQEKELREVLISMSANKNSIGAGIKISKVVRKGSVDYSKVPEINEINLEPYRKPPVECWKITKQ